MNWQAFVLTARLAVIVAGAKVLFIFNGRY